ncbi:acetyl-CoA carboxylase carboxyltransferase subunit beta [bacterium]|jgi:acetyl-CoA carboxylase carboxyl transferase subunit beta|nr:acetyl-CoA carboxylase carboxyltransferase subunit beta [bacterium]
MSIIDWFNQREKIEDRSKKLDIPGDLWVKCYKCSDILYLKDLESSKKVCPSCKYHFRITPEERLQYLFDSNSFEEAEDSIRAVDFLKFRDTEEYKDRLEKARKKTKHADAIIIGVAKIKKRTVNVGIMDFSFMGGSMGSVVGEKITRLIELALENHHPLVMFTSSGGARMQEGIMSLMQMAKTSAALQLLAKKKIPYISVLCDPTMGGTSASFAMLGDINIGEPGALIGFAGPRVIEQTVREKLPKGFQRAEFLLKHGMLDMVVERQSMRDTLAHLVNVLDPHRKPV